MATKAPAKATTFTIDTLKQGEITARLIGTSPFFHNRMASKARRTLLVGGAKKTVAERAIIKHLPLEEYRDSAERCDDGPTVLGIKAAAIKGAMATAALETAGVPKTSVNRLVYVVGDTLAMYGSPQLRMDVVRSADQKSTPDIRTRAFMPRWGVEVTIKFMSPQLSARSVLSLLTNGGFVSGLGDFRIEKGKGAFGAYRIVGHGTKDAEWDDLVANHGRDAQLEALENPAFANDETAELMEFYKAEVARRAA